MYRPRRSASRIETTQGVKVTECEWASLVVDVFVTACLFCSAIRSACAMSTVCGCVAVPVMFSENAVPAVICAAEITAVCPWLAETFPVTLLGDVPGVVGVLSSSQPETVMTTVLKSARADSRVNSRRVMVVASALVRCDMAPPLTVVCESRKGRSKQLARMPSDVPLFFAGVPQKMLRRA